MFNELSAFQHRRVFTIIYSGLEKEIIQWRFLDRILLVANHKKQSEKKALK